MVIKIEDNGSWNLVRCKGIEEETHSANQNVAIYYMSDERIQGLSR
jgi:hypothetical protein